MAASTLAPQPVTRPFGAWVKALATILVVAMALAQAVLVLHRLQHPVGWQASNDASADGRHAVKTKHDSTPDASLPWGHEAGSEACNAWAGVAATGAMPPNVQIVGLPFASSERPVAFESTCFVTLAQQLYAARAPPRV